MDEFKAHFKDREGLETPDQNPLHEKSKAWKQIGYV